MRAAWALLLLTACSQAIPPAAREADRLLRAGDLEGADRIATTELARAPDQAHLRRVWIGVALARRDGRQAASRYQEWRARRGSDDPAALRSMALSTLWSGLGDPDPAVRIAAIATAEAEDLDPLYQDVARLLDDPDPVVRARAAAALLAGDPSLGAPDVLAAAAQGESAAARQVAIATLGRRVGERALPGLRAALADPDPGVRAAAAAAIGRVGDASDVAALTRLATQDPDGPVRASALAALLRLRAPIPASALADPYLGARTTAVAGADDQALRRLTAGEDLALAVTAGARRKELAPFERGSRAPDPSVRALAANLAPGALAPADARRVVQGLAADPQPEVRAAVMRALGTLGDEAAARALAGPLLGVALLGPRLQAGVWLAERGDPRGAATLAALLADPEVAARRTTVAMIRAKDLLVTALGDEDALVRITAAAGLLR